MLANKFKKIHFIGIGGISMSGLAEILLANNKFDISGSDVSKSNLTENLAKKNVKIYIGHNKENITNDINLVVYTAAIKKDNVELNEARLKNIFCLERSEFLGLLMQEYKNCLCIAGTHGKTTTSSMVSQIFLKTKKDPTISLGGILPEINGNFKVGKKDFFIAETCEYNDSFLKFSPHSAIILNIEEDHLDYFKDINQIYNSFKSFANLINKDGLLIINSSIKNYKDITKNLKCKVETYGSFDNANWQAKEISFDENGNGSYKAFYNDKFFCDINLGVAGVHNVYNSLSAVALANFYKVSKQEIQEGLKTYIGTNRRFQKKGYFNKTIVIDDYAHHPTEIKATIATANIKKHNKLWCVFQPHTYTRTKAFLNEFAKSFKGADKVIILDIYAAREKDKGDIHSKDLVDKLIKNNIAAIYLENFEKAKEYLSTNCKDNDMLITMGAGDVYLLGEMLINN